MDYFQKYLKYKTKYLNLKNQENKFTMSGGGPSITKPTLYLFKSETCPYCIRIKSLWEKLQNNSELQKKNIDFVTYDNILNKDKMNIFGAIKGYPTIMFQVDNNTVKEYQGKRDEQSIISFININIKIVEDSKKPQMTKLSKKI